MAIQVFFPILLQYLKSKHEHEKVKSLQEMSLQSLLLDDEMLHEVEQERLQYFPHRVSAGPLCFYSQ